MYVKDHFILYHNTYNIKRRVSFWRFIADDALPRSSMMEHVMEGIMCDGRDHVCNCISKFDSLELLVVFRCGPVLWMDMSTLSHWGSVDDLLYHI